MVSAIYVNLPIADLQRSIAFYTQVGFTTKPEFSDEQSMCMTIGDNIFVMLLTKLRFEFFTDKPAADATQASQMLLAISVATRAEVEGMVQRAQAAGGRIYRDPQDYPFMYGHVFEDPDGHQWEVGAMLGPMPEGDVMGV